MRWTAVASVCTPVIWIPLAVLAGSIRSPVGVASASAATLVYFLSSPILAPLIIACVAPYYLAAFWLWFRVGRRHPSWNRSWKPILAMSATIGVPPALATTVLCARSASGVVIGEFLFWLPFCTLAFLGATILARWLLDPLSPDPFSPGRARPR